MIDFMRQFGKNLSSADSFGGLLTLVLLCCFGCPAPSLATGTQIADPTAPEIAATSQPAFEYQLENRPDPFVPFITEKAASSNVNMDEIVENDEPLTGMQLFEPGQLTVVAMVKTNKEFLAMVQDFTGKGYVLSEGMKIGRHGVVKSFTPQSVIVEETTVTRAGKKSVTEVVMLLKKEEGEK